MALACSGCFVRTQGGYQTRSLGTDPGGGHAELSVGKSDLRTAGKTLKPIQYGIDVVVHAGQSGERLGLGLSALWAPLFGWDHELSPTLRLGARPIQMEWTPTLVPSVSLMAEVGIAYLPDRSRKRTIIYSFSIGAEFFGQQGVRTLFNHRVSALLGVTFDMTLSGKKPRL
jgi:hypothetical protein